MNKIVSAYFTFKFVRLLVTPWTKTPAYKLGVIDEFGTFKGGELTPDQRKAYTHFDRLVFNVKRIIEKVPGGKTRIGTFAAAAFLLKERLDEETFDKVMKVIEDAPTTVASNNAGVDKPMFKKVARRKRYREGRKKK